MTLEEYERRQAEGAARGATPEICCRIDDLPAWPSAWLAPLAPLAAWLRPGQPEPEPEPELEAG